MLIEIKPSDNLMPGVYRIVVVLDKNEDQSYGCNPFYFEMPQLPNRDIIPEREYLCPPTDENGYLRGRFVKGIFLGFCYTDGCPEEINPTSPQKIKHIMEKTIMEKLDMLRKQA